MSGLSLTEDLIKDWTGKALRNLVELDVSGSHIKRIPLETLQSMTHLTSLNLSNNCLHKIQIASVENVKKTDKNGISVAAEAMEIDDDNADCSARKSEMKDQKENVDSTEFSIVFFPNLVELDVSDNCLESLEFLAAMPSLQELKIEGNGFQVSDKHTAVLLCSELRMIDGKSADKLRTFVENCKERYMRLMDSVWELEFESKLTDEESISEERRAEICKEFIQSVRGKRVTLPGGATSTAFRDILTRVLCEEKVEQEFANLSSPSKRSRRSDTQAMHTPNKRSTQATLTPNKATPLKQSQPRTPSSARKTPSSRAHVPTECADVADYVPVKFIRSHFNDRKALRLGHTDNDPTDEITNVWCCVMEPHPNNPGETTGTVATCGGDTVCLIDCSTGRVMKRFQQHKEQFYTLAWTSLTLQYSTENDKGLITTTERKENILAVGGLNGHIRLLDCSQLVCYAEYGNGRPNRAVNDFYYSSLVFHPTRPTWLFCGSSDTTITLLDIGTPTGPEYSVEISKLLIFMTQPARQVLNLLMLDFGGGRGGSGRGSWGLLAGTEQGLMLWGVPEDPQQPKNNITKKIDTQTEVFITSQHRDKSQIDGLTLINKQLAACKCVSRGCIYVVDLSSLSTKTKGRGRVTLDPLMVLDWTTTDVDYIGLTYRNGLIGCGDDKGSIWLYNISPLITENMQKSTTSLAPSRILQWPQCVLEGERKEAELKMTDVLDKPEPLVVNSLCFSSDCSYLVGVTDCNLVLIWKKVVES